MSADEDFDVASTTMPEYDMHAAAPGHMANVDETNVSPLKQVPLIERLKKLEEEMPKVEESMCRTLHGKRPSSMIGQGTLLSRVEALEKAMGILLETQESLLVAKRRSGSQCCTIM